jgi:O-antigen/teichoic acid export membrane protein
MPASMMLTVFLTVSLVTLGKAKLSSFLSIFFAVISVISVCLPVALGKTLDQTLYIYMAVRVLIAFISFLLIWKIVGFQPNIDKELIYGQFKFSIPYWLGYAVFFGYTQIHKILVSSCFTPEDFAIFSIGSTELPVIGHLATQISWVLIPVCIKLRKDDNIDKIAYLWEKSASNVALVTVPVFTILVTSPRQFLELVFGLRYGRAWPIFIVTSLLMLLKICSIQSLFKISGKTQYVILSSSAALLVGLGSGWALLYPCGLLGPAIGIVLGRIAQIFVALVYIQKDLPIPLSRLFALKKTSRIFMVSVIACFIAKMICLRITASHLYLLVNVPVSTVLFFIIARNTGVLQSEDTAIIKRWITLRPFLESH